MILGILGPLGIITIAVVYLAVFIYACYLVVRRERGITLLAWLAAILLLPFVGGALYIIRYRL